MFWFEEPEKLKYIFMLEYPMYTFYFSFRGIKGSKNSDGFYNRLYLSPGMLLKQVGRAYKMAYENEEAYGIWGHSITDLVIERIYGHQKDDTVYFSFGLSS